MVSLNKENLETWQQQDLEHLRYHSYKLNPTDYVIDIGSYRNEWGNEIKRLYGCKVEPFDALNNKAAWLFDGELTFGGAYYYSSIYEPGTTTYKCVDIAPYLNNVSLVKINIEGGEYDLLDYILSKGLHKNIKYLQVQFHEVEGLDYLTRYEQIKTILQTTHKLQWCYPFVWESWELLK